VPAEGLRGGREVLCVPQVGPLQQLLCELLRAGAFGAPHAPQGLCRQAALDLPRPTSQAQLPDRAREMSDEGGQVRSGCLKLQGE